MSFVTIYTTASSHEEADRIAKRLLNDRLVACVNIVDGVRSLYHWQGVIEDATEVTLLCKTRDELFEQVATTVRDVHSYDTPCIVAWPIADIDTHYAAWIDAEVAI